MNSEDIELHDANLKSTTVDYVAQTVVLEIDYYPTEKARNRIAASFKFNGVSTYNENSNIKEVKKYSKSGGCVVSWFSAPKSGTTYIYLARGFISITARGLEVIKHA